MSFGALKSSEGLARLLLTVSPKFGQRAQPSGRSHLILQQRRKLETHRSSSATAASLPEFALGDIAFQVLRSLSRRGGIPAMSDKKEVKKRQKKEVKTTIRPPTQKSKGFGAVSGADDKHPWEAQNWNLPWEIEVPPPDWESSEWKSLLEQLDTLPVFTILTEREKPLTFDSNGVELQVYFVDAARAQNELDKMLEAGNDFRLTAEGLGQAFRKTVEGSALLMPSVDSLERTDEQWKNVDIPLFTCFGIKSLAVEGNSLGVPPGTQTLPLFLDAADAAASLSRAIEMTNETIEPNDPVFQVAITSLPVAVDIVLRGDEVAKYGAPFQFVAPRSSIELVNTIYDAEIDRMQPREALIVKGTGGRSEEEDDIIDGSDSDKNNILFPGR
jgi:hypothetical protein